MRNVLRWPCKLAAVLAVLVGVLLLLGGGGHLSAVLEARAGQPFDYRFVSLLTTSGILLFPGIVSLIACYSLWHGRIWAYVSCLLSTSALMLYLGLLVYMKTQAQDAATAAGPEVYFFAVLTPAYFIVIAGVLLWLQWSRTPEPFAACESAVSAARRPTARGSSESRHELSYWSGNLVRPPKTGAAGGSK